MCILIKSHIGENFTTRTRYNDAVKFSLQLRLETPDDYRKIVHVLDESNADYHSYQLKADRTFRVAIKFLHPTTNLDVIKEELNEKGFKVWMYTMLDTPSQNLTCRGSS